jgi:uncharacterized protein (DUF924 family)
MQPLAREILDFWFGPPPHAPRGEWFRKDAAFDATIAQRFGKAIDAAIGGAYREWSSDAHGALARILLLDQFTRNVFRGKARAFAGDAEALATATALVDRGLDRTLDRYERNFVYLPFEHSEDRQVQDRSIALFTELARDTGDRGALDWAEKHAAIIRRFGRYPHRNEALGRASTPEELAFLEEPGSSF